MPPAVLSLAQESRGLVLVTGATGSGKSTTLAALVDRINRTRPMHILTHRGSDRVHPHRPARGHQPARGRARHAVVRGRPQERAAAGPGRHPARRDARRGDDRDGAGRRRNRAPRALDASHPRRARNHQPYRRGLCPAPPGPDPAPARARAARGRVAAPASAARTARAACWRPKCSWPRPTSRTASPTASTRHPPRRRHRGRRVRVRHAELRPGDSQSVPRWAS